MGGTHAPQSALSPVAAAKVSASTVCEGEVRVLDGVRDLKPGIARRQLGAPSLVAGLLERDDGILRRALRSIGRVEPPLQLQNLGSQLATVRLLLAALSLQLHLQGMHPLKSAGIGTVCERCAEGGGGLQEQERQQGPTHAEGCWRRPTLV